jgi:hypothetical protein
MGDTVPFLRLGTPLEDHLQGLGLLVKREDLSCPPPGPPFSKTRGVLGHVQARYNEGVRVFGALDTFHSQAGHAVAAACRHVGAQCLNYFPVYKREVMPADLEHPADKSTITFPDGTWAVIRDPQLRSLELGARLMPLAAGRSALLFWKAKAGTEAEGGYMMPNALKLPETVTETAAEVVRTFEAADRETYNRLRSLPWVVSASSGTIAAGVLRGLHQMLDTPPQVIVHMGYDRPQATVETYITDKAAVPVASRVPLLHIQEGYAYADKAKAGPDPSWPCNPWYDLKAFRWWMREGRSLHGQAVFWNIG